MHRTIANSFIAICSLLIGLTSCRHLEDELEHFEAEIAVTKCINVTTNVNAEIVIGNRCKTGRDVLFDIDGDAEEELTMSVSAVGYQSQEVIICFDLNNAIGLDIQLFPDTIAPEKSPIYVIGRIMPVGSVVSIPTSEGPMTIEVVDVKEGKEETTGSMNAYKGDRVIPYQHKTGYESNQSNIPYINNFLKCAFGTPVRQLPREAIYKSTTSSRIEYTIIQSYSDYTFMSGSTRFSARVYQGVKIKVAGEYIDTFDYVYGGSGESSGL